MRTSVVQRVSRFGGQVCEAFGLLPSCHLPVIMVLCAVALMGADTSLAQGRGEGPDARGVFGGGRAIRQQDIPPGKLRGQLDKLPPQALENALKNLEKMTFHQNDLPSLGADAKGRIHYGCSFSRPGAAPHADEEEHVCASGCSHEASASAALPSAEEPLPKVPLVPIVAAAAVPISSPPIYHSRPGSPNTIFLDFNGHLVTNTAWWRGDANAWNCRPFSSDGDETTFSEAEQIYIYQMWQRVAEDYASFDVDVTTEEPVWSPRTAHALITPTIDADGVECPHYGLGGKAYVGVFGTDSFSYDYNGNCLSPAWVKPMADDSYAAAAEAASHEIGHNMGLSHDGTSTLEYYGGHMSSANAPSWGPLMGTGYYRDVSQWSKGDYYDANNTQDDLAMIALKVGYIPDDHGDTTVTASDMIQDGVSVSVTGVVETTGDVDVFAVPTGDGTIDLSLQPMRVAAGTWGSNLDAALLLYNSSGTLLASNNPADTVSAGVSVAVSSGTYYAHVVPVGAGDPMNSTPRGYAVYGSVGQYTLEGTVAPLGNIVFLLQPNGGTRYRGQTNIVTWSAGFTNAVDLDLYKGGVLYGTIASGVNGSSYAWAVPGDQMTGADYRIRVSKVGEPATYDESDNYFSILEPPSYLLDEDFEASAGLPTGWTQATVTGTAVWTVDDGGHNSHPESAHSGSRNMLLYRMSQLDNRQRLFTPSFDAAGYTDLTLTFWHCMQAWSADQDFLRIYYRTNATADWALIADYTNDVPMWVERVITLPESGDGCAVAFEGKAKYGYGVCIDDVIVSGHAPLPYVVAHSPTGLCHGTVSSIDITFSRPMDTDSFSLGEDVASFTGPSGSITATNFMWLANTLLRVYFPGQSADGNYTLVVGPDILDDVGMGMDQDRDSSVGESVEDRYTATFNINNTSYIAAPTDLGAVPALGTRIELAWSDNSVNEDGFAIERSLISGSGFAVVGSTTSNTLSYSDTDVIADTTYYYRVYATNGVTNSAYTSEASATIPLPPHVDNDTGATAMQVDSATLRGVLSTGILADAWICWGLTDGGTQATGDWDSVLFVGSVAEDTPFATNVAGLATNTTYFYRCFVSNSTDVAWSQTAENFSAMPSGLGAGGGVPIGDSYYEWDAGDNSGTDTWVSTTTNAYEWTFDNGVQIPVDVVDARFEIVTKAYEFPAAKDSNAPHWQGRGDTEPATFEFVLDVDGSDGVIFETGGSGDGMEIDVSGGVLRGTVEEDDPNARVSYTLTPADSNRFIHVIFVADNSNNVVQLYVDGELKDEQAWTLGEDWSGTDAGGIGAKYGSVPDDGGATNDFTGKIALFRYYRNKAFTAAEVTVNYDALSPGDGVANLAPTGIDENGGTARARLSASGEEYDVYVYWGDSDGGTNPVAWSTNTYIGSWSNAVTNISYSVGPLMSSTPYYYTFYASNTTEGVWASPSWAFTTPGAPKATPTVMSWPVAGTISYGEAVSNATLSGGSASVSGGFGYSSPATMPDAGIYVAGVTFTPTDTTNYATVAGTVDVTVNQVTPTVNTWPTAASIIEGQPLSDATLSGGSATVPGSFSYDAPATEPTMGTYVADVTFTPTDSVNYESVAGTVNVDVSEPVPLPPSGLSVTAVDRYQVELSWTDNSDNEDNFVVQRSTTSESGFADLAVVAADSAGYSDTTVTENTTYYYRVAGTNSYGLGPYSAEANDTTPATQHGTLSLSSSTYSIDEDGSSVTLTVTRTGGADDAVSVDIATRNGTALAGSDYTGDAQTLNWSDEDDTNKTLVVSIGDDGVYSGDREFYVDLSSAGGGAGIGTDTATITIIEDEPVPTGAWVVAQSPVATNYQMSGVTQVTLTFSESINTGTFSVVDDITAFTGAKGIDLLGTVTGYSWANSDTELTISFESLTNYASYRLVVGPDIRNLNGWPMDQDQDGALGEDEEDQYAATIWVSGGGTDVTVWSDLLDADDTPDAGWTLGTDWEIGVPTEDGVSGPNADTDAGTKILAQNLAGNYTVIDDETSAQTPAIDGSSFTSVQLDFQEWKGLGKGDVMYVDILSGTTTNRVYSYTGPNGGANDGGWSAHNIDISAAASNREFQVIWGLQDTSGGGSGEGTGWQLDAIRVSGSGPTPVPPAPVVVAHSPAGDVASSVASVYIEFSQPMDAGSFSTGSDIASFDGPSGAIAATGSTWVSSTLLRIDFEEQAADGSYTLVLEPGILDDWGQVLDQDKDGTSGEATQDRYTASFSISNANYIPAPSALSAVAISSTQVDLAWTDSSTNETGFMIERSLTSGFGFAEVGAATADATNYNDTTVSPGVTYYYQVTATNGTDSSAASAESFATTPKVTATVTLGNLSETYDGAAKTVTTVTDPVGLTVDVTYNGGSSAPTNAGSYAVVATINETAYEGATNGTLIIAQATPTVTTWPTASVIIAGQAISNATLSGGSASVVGIFNYDAPGTTPGPGVHNADVIFSPTDSVNYESMGPEVVEVYVRPTAPQNLQGTPSEGAVELTWTGSAGSTNYNVKRATVSGGPYTTIASPSVTNHTDGSVVSGVTYYYVVSAINVVESMDSSEASATLPYVLPFAETFDGNGMSTNVGVLNGQNGWVSGTNALVSDGVGRTVGRGLALVGDTVEHGFTSDSNTVSVSVWCKPIPGTTPPGIDPDVTAVFWAGTNLYVMAYSNETIVTLPVQVDTNTWTHFVAIVDYDAGTWELEVNGSLAGTGLGLYSAQTSFSCVGFQNTAADTFYIDDVSISNAAAQLSRFDYWLIGNYGTTSVDESGIVSNGVNTVREAYIIGLNPHDPDALFQLNSIASDADEAMLEWLSVSGRVYNIYWSSNLYSEFRVLQTNIPWTVNTFTDSVDSIDERQRFYRIGVELDAQ